MWDVLRRELMPWAYEYSGGNIVQVGSKKNVGVVRNALKKAGIHSVQVSFCALTHVTPMAQSYVGR